MKTVVFLLLVLCLFPIGTNAQELSTALPREFSRGIQLGSNAPTGIHRPPMGGFSCRIYTTRENFQNPPRYLSPWVFNGQSMANYAVFRGVSRGLRF